MKQQELPAHAAYPGVDRSGRLCSFFFNLVILNPMKKIPAEFFHITPVPRETVCQIKFIHIIMAVQHVDPFRISVRSTVPLHLFQMIRCFTGFHIPLVHKPESLVLQLISPFKKFLCLSLTVLPQIADSSLCIKLFHIILCQRSKTAVFVLHLFSSLFYFFR